MKVAFRVDASDRIGTGHHMRCMTLAESLRERGARILFICRAHQGHLVGLLRQAGLPVSVLAAPPGHETPAGEDSYAGWLGSTQAEDAAQTIVALGGEKPDWLVVDHYALDAEWEQSMRPHVGKLMAIDDLANRRHDCDLLCDQNYSLQGERRYAGLVPAGCKLLVGPRYALLRPEYVQYRATSRPRDGEVRKVLVFFGGSDLRNMTGAALASLSTPELKHLDLDVVVGANNPHRKVLEELAAGRPRTTLHGPRPHLADLMAAADLAVGAGGATTWERMCLGLPSVVVAIADNQRAACEALAHAKLVEYMGSASDLSAGRLSQALRALIEQPGRLAGLSLQNQLAVDGLGARRLAEALCPSDAQRLRLRQAQEQDVGLYFGWANDSEVRSSAINSSPIAWDTHRAWFADKLRDRRSHLLVLEADGLPAGQIRFDLDGACAWIDYSLDPLVRGRGWGRRLVDLGVEWMGRVGTLRICAAVKPENVASCATFLALGFKECPGQPAAQLKSFYLDPDQSSSMEKS